MKNLLIKLQNKRKEEKGFTLVELLVVIAILAILASVSVVGYMGFTQKAKESNAQTELVQAKTVITTSLLDGKDEKAVYTIGDNNSLYFYDNSIDGTDTEKDVATFITTHFTDLSTLKGTFGATGSYTAATESAKASYNVTTITYTLDTAVATWTIATGAITTARA